MNDASSDQTRGRVLEKHGYTEVDKIPRRPKQGTSYWLNSPNGKTEYTHHFFRFPAKFHTPVVRWALGTYGRRGSLVLDPFVGSGTVQVEALLRGINSIGIDIDPLACLISRAKITPVDPIKLQQSLAKILIILSVDLNAHSEVENFPGADITDSQYDRESDKVRIPDIPNIKHWFRRYVIVDLARLIEAIKEAELGETETNFFNACVASIIRRVSNADPDPVSGLEVTKIQILRNGKRTISVFKEFIERAEREIKGMGTLWNAIPNDNNFRALTEVIRGNVLEIESIIDNLPLAKSGIPLVLTSPPYCRSVEYSRRHRLELFWLGMVEDQEEHIDLTHNYLGRRYVRVNDWSDEKEFGIAELDVTLRQIRNRNQHKARTVHHYFYKLSEVFGSLRKIMRQSGTLIYVVGNSVCCGIPIRTVDFLAELASEHFRIDNRFSYAIQNHHMQYGLWNGDGIKEEYVIVFKPRL